MSKQILILPGDGIGPEIMAEAVKVLQRIDTQHGLGFELVYDELGGAAYDKYGSPWPMKRWSVRVLPMRCCWARWVARSGTPSTRRYARNVVCSRSARSWGCSPICVRHCCIRSWPTPPR